MPEQGLQDGAGMNLLQKRKTSEGAAARKGGALHPPHPLALLPGWLSLTLGHRIHRSL